MEFVLDLSFDLYQYHGCCIFLFVFKFLWIIFDFTIFLHLFISGWTSSAANSYCSEYISSSAAAKECKFLVQPSRYSDSCQSDVLYSGNSRLASLHLKNLKEDCRQVIQTDQSLALTSKHKEDILKTLCLSSCSGHGTCQDGIIFSFD